MAEDTTAETTKEAAEAAYPEVDTLLADIVGDDESDFDIPTEAKEAPEPDTEAGESEDESSPDVDQEALHSAYTALYRDGLGQELIDQMSEEQIVAYGAKALKRQSDVDAAFRERDQLRTNSKTEPKPTESTEEPATASSTGDTSAVLRDMVQPLGELIGDEEANAVSKLMTGAFDRLIGPLLQQNTAMNEALTMRLMQREMVEEFPQLKNRGEFKKVADNAVELMGTNLHEELEGFDRLRALMETSFRLSDSGKASPGVTAKKRKGHMQGASGRKRADKALTEEELTDARIKMVMEGKSSEEIKAAFGS